MFSPASKVGIVPGYAVVTINDWNVEAMDNIQVRDDDDDDSNDYIDDVTGGDECVPSSRIFSDTWLDQYIINRF